MCWPKWNQWMESSGQNESNEWKVLVKMKSVNGKFWQKWKQWMKSSYQNESSTLTKRQKKMCQKTKCRTTKRQIYHFDKAPNDTKYWKDIVSTDKVSKDKAPNDQKYPKYKLWTDKVSNDKVLKEKWQKSRLIPPTA